MIFMVEGEVRSFIPIQTFRAEWGLPSTFSTATFQPKAWEGLGSVERASSAIHTMRSSLLESLPNALALPALLPHIHTISTHFEQQLLEANEHIGLKSQEIDFAVSGLEGVLSAFAYEAIRQYATHAPPPTFEAVYYRWLQDSVHVDGTVYPYPYHDEAWCVQLIHHAYGRVGMCVTLPKQVVYVEDKTLACPAEGIMASLLRALITHLNGALANGL